MSCQSPGEDITINLKSANNTGRVGSIKGTIKKTKPKNFFVLGRTKFRGVQQPWCWIWALPLSATSTSYVSSLCLRLLACGEKGC